MSSVDLLLATFGVSLIFFEPAMEIGATQKNLTKKRIAVIGIAFGLAQMVVAALGVALALLIGLLIPDEIQIIIRPVITFVILIVSGIYMLYFAFLKREIIEFRKASMTAKKSIALAGKYSLPVIAVCVGLYCVSYDWLAEILLIPIMSVLLAILGLFCGYRIGFKYRKVSYLVGGIILCIIAFKAIML